MTISWLGLAQSRVLVIGAGGIGGAVARGFAAQGARVAVIDRDEERLSDLAADEVTARVADVTDEVALGAAVASATVALGGLDVAVHCVGMNDRRELLEFTIAEWDRIVRVNLTSAFLLVRDAGPHLLESRFGRLIFLSSVAGTLGHAHHGPYAATKGGINQLARVTAREWAPRGATVNAVAPGYIETALTADYLARPGVRDELVRLVPAGRLGIADEVVDTILFLASPRASFITGQVVHVDGGRTLV